MAKHVLDLAVLPFPDREGEPHIGPLHAIHRRLDRAIAYTLDADASMQPIELLLGYAAMGAHAIAAQPTRRRQLEQAREASVIRQKQKPFGVEIEPPHADKPGQAFRQDIEDSRAAARIAVRGKNATR